MTKFNPGELVFAKFGNFPLWPGQILCEDVKSKTEAFHISFFGLTVDVQVVDATSIIRYSDEELKHLRENTEEHTKPYTKALNEIELKFKEYQASNDRLSDIRLTRSSRSYSYSPSSPSSGSLSPSSSSSCSSTNVQLKSLRKTRLDFNKSSTAKSKSKSKQVRARVIVHDNIANGQENTVAEQTPRKRSKKSSMEKRELEVWSVPNLLSNSITFTMDLEEINRQLAQQSFTCSFYDVLSE